MGKNKKFESKPNYDLYDILEVSPRARPEVIDAAYITLMKQYHPDKGGDNRIAVSLNNAREILLDHKKRKAYDESNENLEGKIVGNYRIIEQIAEGGFGKTYLGEHIHFGSMVCIKHENQISPQDEEILIDEAKAMWDLRHYGIPAIRDLLKLDDGSLALVMSYIPGPTLEQAVKKVGGLESEDVAWITERSLNVLRYLHYNGVVHGDVKPQNIIIQPESHNIVLVDYGLSAIKPTSSDGCKGYTPYFASPEQENGETILPESDFYSLGLTMIYALGGDAQQRKVPGDVPDEFCHFIKKLIARDILLRPNWEKEDLCAKLQDLRMKVFGRRHSDMKAIRGLA
ncbi:Chaperone protein DnaJ [uncultured archaeon]|nr:Chaperone protein DnaJ [uncultured archaeon]